MNTPEPLAQANKRVIGRLLLLTVAMFGFGFALVPLYDVFCQITGLNGKTGRIDERVAQASQVDTSRWVTVEFTGQAMNGLPWEFRPLQNKLRVHPGETAVVKYYVRNTTAETMTGQAVPSVSPPRAASHFKKVECFCFSRQQLEGGQSEEMPVRFLVESDLPEDVKTLTLSYAFYDVDSSPARRVGSNARLAIHGRESSHRPASSGG
ncbi:MAG: cytochrome c oxidase assembly protein [Acidiferrobacterales bacterium]